MEHGRLIGVSVGPGDPELLTIKALRTLENAEIIAVPRTSGKNTMALDIIRQLVDIKEKEILYLDFVMSRDRTVTDRVHRELADKVEDYLKRGEDVVLVNIGDASLFGTYSYIQEIILSDGFASQTIPGVTSFCAVAAELNRSLTSMNEPLTIIPGGRENLGEALDGPGTKVIMKSASALEEVKRILKEKNLMDKAAAVCDCGLPSQKVYTNIEDIPQGEYFITIIVS